ncbi:4-hydroxybenzoate polyprenyl transferase [Seiridium cupressi]
MTKNNTVIDKESANGNSKVPLSQQYGGIHVGGWVNLLPKSWVPYVQLARLSPPAALFLIYFPHFFGVLHAANTHNLPWPEVRRAAAMLLGGSFFFSNAAHAWNDLIDAPIDAKIARTKNRPIVRGAISRRAAFLFTVSQAVGAAAFLLFLNVDAAKAAAVTIIGTTYYPWAKRHTNFPQVILGFCLAWGIMVGNAATGVENPWTDPAALLLVLASTTWTVIYDTIYAHQDIKDDIKIGVKSLAVLLQNRTKALLWSLLALMITSLIAYGQLAETSIIYYLITVGGCCSSLGAMIANVELKEEASCWWWFSVGFWFTGLSIALGLAQQYLLADHYEIG